MNKVVFFAFRNHKMCFQHLMLNAFDIIEKGGQAKIVFEGEAVKLPQVLTEENNPLYKKALAEGVIDGVCEACSKAMDVFEVNKELGVTFLSDLKGHPAMDKYLKEGFQVITL
ncbi:MAG: hypothetical protein Q4E50_04770 [Tissierellia bacterium]|nr:hypothetical protein [Tissierellia bacterium]